MEQPCYKCGQPVEEGVPFCPHCSAPQIRVVLTEPPSIPVPAGELGTEPESANGLSMAQTSVALQLRGAHILKPCALAALVTSILVSLGLNLSVGTIGVGFLAVVFYRQHMPGIAIPGALGAKLGAVSGPLCFSMSAILRGILVVTLHEWPELRDQILQKVQESASGTSDPQVLAFFNYIKTPEGLAVMMAFALIFGLILSIALGALGGGLGSMLLGRRNKA